MKIKKRKRSSKCNNLLEYIILWKYYDVNAMHRIMQKVLAKNKITINIITTKVTNQKSFCCCWIFPGLNILREMFGKNLKTSEFEIS